MNPNHATTIKERYLSAISLNDVDAFEALGLIYDRAKELGYTLEQIQQVFKEARDESSRDKQHPEPVQQPEPRETEPVTPTPPQAVQDKRTEAQLSRRVEARVCEVPGLNPSGVKVRQSKVSILDLADKRVDK